MNNLKQASVSVIIPSYNSSATIKKCLRSLENQQTDEPFEVIVVDSSTDNTAGIVREDFPFVRLYLFSERKYPGEARNVGVSQAQADILAFTDADCIAAPNWIAEIIKAHRSSHPISTGQAVIGGALDNGNPESYIGWAYYFCKFSQWMPQSKARPMIECPTGCLSVKKWAFEQYGPFREKGYCSDTEFNMNLVKAGYRPFFIPTIKVSHINISRLSRFLAHQPRHGKAFAQLRVKAEDFSSARRLLYVVGSPLLPFLLWFRVAKRVFTTKSYMKQFIASTPLIFLGLVAWSIGELLGYALPKAESGVAQSERSRSSHDMPTGQKT